MKRLTLLCLFLALAMAACAPNAQEPAVNGLKVSDGKVTKTFTAADLKTLAEEQVAINGVSYFGVPLTVLLQATGIDPAALTAVKAVASDGFSANYDPALFGRKDTIVAYARVDGPLGDDEAPFRMVLPAEGGKMNPRQLTEIVAIP